MFQSCCVLFNLFHQLSGGRSAAGSFSEMKFCVEGTSMYIYQSQIGGSPIRQLIRITNADRNQTFPNATASAASPPPAQRPPDGRDRRAHARPPAVPPHGGRRPPRPPLLPRHQRPGGLVHPLRRQVQAAPGVLSQGLRRACGHPGVTVELRLQSWALEVFWNFLSDVSTET